MKNLLSSLFLVLFVSACVSQADVGKNFKPNTETPCPVTESLSIMKKMVDAAKKNDNATTMNMMSSGDVLMLDLTKSYKIVGQGGYWYKISVDGKDLYVLSHMGKVY